MNLLEVGFAVSTGELDLEDDGDDPGDKSGNGV